MFTVTVLVAVPVALDIAGAPWELPGLTSAEDAVFLDESPVRRVSGSSPTVRCSNVSSVSGHSPLVLVVRIQQK